MGECMEFPEKWEDFVEQYSFRDKEQVYTNGSELIPVFRVKQMMEHYLPKVAMLAVQEHELITSMKNKTNYHCGRFRSFLDFPPAKAVLKLIEPGFFAIATDASTEVHYILSHENPDWTCFIFDEDHDPWENK